jgi:hypothetical protein
MASLLPLIFVLLSSLAHVRSSCFPHSPIPPVEHLYIHSGSLLLRWQGDIKNSQWL